MEHIRKLLPVLFFASFFVGANTAWAATYAGVDNFESYSLAALSGDNGGSGWTAAWSSTPTSVTVVSSPTYTGSRSVQANASGPSTSRTFTAASSGTMYVSMYANNTTDIMGVIIQDGANGKIYIFFNNTSGNISFFNGTAYQVLVTSFSTNTWYRIGIQWDNANHPNQAEYNVNNGAWTGWFNVNGTFATLDTINLNQQSLSSAFYWDDISNVYSAAVASVPTPILSYFNWDNW